MPVYLTSLRSSRRKFAASPAALYLMRLRLWLILDTNFVYLPVPTNRLACRTSGVQNFRQAFRGEIAARAIGIRSRSRQRMMSFLPWRRTDEPDREGALSEWRQGRDAIVIDIPWADRLSCRLRELGLLPGVRLRVLRTGSRLVIQIGEARLALRRVDAAAIRVAAVRDVAANSAGL